METGQTSNRNTTFAGNFWIAGKNPGTKNTRTFPQSSPTVATPTSTTPGTGQQPPRKEIQKIANSAWEMYDYSDYRVVSGNYLKCSSLSFTYEFGERILPKLRMSRLALTLSGTNLFTICSSKLKGQTATQSGFRDSTTIRPTDLFIQFECFILKKEMS